jgi:hypothetical protein
LGRSDDDDEWLHHWLNTPTSDGKPRVLVLYISYWDELGTFIENIRKVCDLCTIIQFANFEILK